MKSVALFSRAREQRERVGTRGADVYAFARTRLGWGPFAR